MDRQQKKYRWLGRKGERKVPQEKTELLKKYYQETDPMRRRRILEKSIDQGEELEKNRIRMELWEARYQHPSRAAKGERADGFLRLWIQMKYADDNTGGILGGRRRSRKEVQKEMDRLGFLKWQRLGGLYEECFYEECLHLAALYMESCHADKSYGSGIMGLMALSEEKIMDKLTDDVYGIAFRVPEALGLTEELSILTRAICEVYSARYPADEFEEIAPQKKRLLGRK
ncbi:MAG: hypothetical protein Q4E89_03630 [Eubacteriales bacterium]|nr:hypothetical protein [Eubacteriales bacterium]